MKKIVVLLLLLVIFGGSVYAVNGNMGIITNVSTSSGAAGLGFTWKNGIANNSVLNVDVGFVGGLAVNAAYHFTFIDQPIADIDWLYWNIEAGPYAGVALATDSVGFRVGGEAAIGLSVYLTQLFNENIPLEFFLQGGPYVGIAVPSDSIIEWDPFVVAAGIRWVF